MKIGLLLSGNGVYDGAEIHEAVLTMLAIEEMGWQSVCIGINKPQHHVIDHLSGTEMQETRNMLVEAARIARGKIQDIINIEAADLDALVIPGGFGSAKNFTSWAFDGPNSTIIPEVKLLLVNLVNVGKPIIALCVSPVVIAKAFEGSSIKTSLSLGTSKDASPYDIAGFHQGIESIGAHTEERAITECLIDYNNRIICAPCYMMEASILEVRTNIKLALEQLKALL